MNSVQLPKHMLRDQVQITLVGAGGNGSQMLYGLARLHMALLALGHPAGLHVTVYDPDLVSPANIGRQLFSPADIGHAKAMILVHRLNTHYGLKWSAECKTYPNSDWHYTPSIIIGCVDTASSRRQIHKWLEKRSADTWWLDLGNEAHTGQVVLGKLRKDDELTPPTVTELFPKILDPKAKEPNLPSCSMEEALTKQDLFINQSVATFALDLLWKWFRRGAITHHGYFVNLQLGRVSPMPIDPEAWKRITAASQPVTKPRNRKTQCVS